MELVPGQVVDRYIVEELVGRGGMAKVWRVRHSQLGTWHALKVLSAPSFSVRERLLVEGRVQAGLRHPNVVSVSDVIDLGGVPGLIAEFVRGPSLEALLRARRLGLAEADLLARGLLSGVAAAHEAGLVHRDLKPANILLEISRGTLTPKITDFGLAKILDAEGTDALRTRSGTSMGTPPYMAPEQVRDSSTVDRRADVFSLGAILYELLVGERAFQGNDVFEVVTAVAFGRYRPLAEVLPGVPARMSQAIEAALQVEADRRPADGAALLRIWEEAVATPGPDSLAEVIAWAQAIPSATPAPARSPSDHTWNTEADGNEPLPTPYVGPGKARDGGPTSMTASWSSELGLGGPPPLSGSGPAAEGPPVTPPPPEAGEGTTESARDLASLPEAAQAPAPPPAREVLAEGPVSALPDAAVREAQMAEAKALLEGVRVADERLDRARQQVLAPHNPPDAGPPVSPWTLLAGVAGLVLAAVLGIRLMFPAPVVVVPPVPVPPVPVVAPVPLAPLQPGIPGADATVTVTGVDRAALRSVDGLVGLGTVKPGKYTLLVWFGGNNPTEIGPLELSGGQVVDLRCDVTTLRCAPR